MTGIIQKLFGNQKPQPDGSTSQTADLTDKPMKKTNSETLHNDPPQLIVGCAQSVGMQRDHNEDALFTLTTTIVNDKTSIIFGFYIVADGMGGHKYGEVASGVAVRAMSNQIIQKLYTPLFSVKPTPPAKSIQEIMRDGIQEAHLAITHDAPGGGTTLTGVLVLGEQLTIAHVGDSRAYTISQDGKMQTLTRDHSFVNRLVELGQISTEEAAVHPQRNVLYRALGQGEPFEADISTTPMSHSGYLLICSDGLWGVVPDEKLSEMIMESGSPQEACSKMIAAANEAGGPDNITAVLIRMPD